MPEIVCVAGHRPRKDSTMLKKAMCSAVLLAALFVTLSADVWDDQSDNDDGTGTDNELIHGTSQIHDLGVRPGPVADQDWYKIGQKRQSSYEIVMDSTSGDIGLGGLALQRIESDATTVLQNAASITPGLDYSRSLRWANTAATTVPNQFIKVSGAACGVSCGADDVYHIRAYETTISVARFNNSGTQLTVVILQNPTNTAIAGTLFFYNAVGTLLATANAPVPAKGLVVISTPAISGLEGQAGSLTIAHDGGYGSLNVKAVALEPSTGFSFDTPGVYRPR
jgi:hypothetical protein